MLYFDELAHSFPHPSQLVGWFVGFANRIGLLSANRETQRCDFVAIVGGFHFTCYRNFDVCFFLVSFWYYYLCGLSWSLMV